MTLPAGFTVGHWTDPVALTGCTVILCDGAATAGVHMGGGAPATIQTDIIGPGSATGILHAVLLTGGSAFGLGSAGKIDSLEIRWPDGAIQTLRDIPGGARLTVTEGRQP